MGRNENRKGIEWHFYSIYQTNAIQNIFFVSPRERFRKSSETFCIPTCFDGCSIGRPWFRKFQISGTYFGECSMWFNEQANRPNQTSNLSKNIINAIGRTPQNVNGDGFLCQHWPLLMTPKYRWVMLNLSIHFYGHFGWFFVSVCISLSLGRESLAFFFVSANFSLIIRMIWFKL